MRRDGTVQSHQGGKIMKLLSHLAGVFTALLLSAVALSSTAYAKLPPDDPEGPVRVVPPMNDAPPAPVDSAVGSGLSTLQVVVLLLCVAVAAAVITAFVTRHPSRTKAPATA
jgi:hypothetical protein